MVKKNAIFFDRDGVLIKAPVDNNNKPKSIKTYDQIEWIDDIENICSFYKKNYYLIMVTNQPDVTRKINSIKNVKKINSEIKKGSFRLQMFLSGVFSSEANWGTGQDRGGATSGDVVDGVTTIGDYLSTTEYRTSPAGDYGLLFTGSAPASTDTPSAHATASIGLVFYQAGVVVLTSSVIQGDFGDPDDGGLHHGPDAHADSGDTGIKLHAIHFAQSGSNINQLANGLRHLIHDIDFNNTIELNSSIYFCRVNHNEFNYSSNPTYVSGSKLVVKNNITDLPLSYITTVGLYSPDNELMAVAKLSEPIRKDPNTELTLRVRLDY